MHNVTHNRRRPAAAIAVAAGAALSGLVAAAGASAAPSAPSAPSPAQSADCAPPAATGPQFTIDVLALADFFHVPQLGCEPVAGTGCGGNGSIGDVIPDGLWRGNLVSLDGATVAESASLQFDLTCPYVGDAGQQMFDELMAENPDYGSPPWNGHEFMVNNSERARAVPLADDFVMLPAYWVPVTPLDSGYENRCVSSRSMPGLEPAELPGPEDAWLWIDGGVARQAVVAIGCPHD